MKDQIQLQGVFAYLDELLNVLRLLRQKNIAVSDVHSPVPHREITELTVKRQSPIRFITLSGAILGIISGFGLSVFTAWQWKFIVSGKPPVPRVPYVIEAFEFCILFGVLFNVVGMLLLSRLPRIKLPDHYDARVTEDRFSVLISCPKDERESISKLLHEAGAEEVNAF